MTKKFTAQTGPNNTVKIFDAMTGQLCRTITPGGRIDGQPVCSDSSLFVTVNKGSTRLYNQYTLPNGGLKSSKPL